MSSIKFSDGMELPVFSAIAGSAFIQGTNRETIQLQIDKTAISFENLDVLTADLTKTGKITLIDGDQQFVHDNYCIRAELAIKLISNDSKFCVTLAKKTDAEIQIDGLAKDQVGNKIMMSVLESATQSAIESLEG